MIRVIALGPETDDAKVLWAMVSVYLVYFFFNRSQNGHFLLVEDMWVEDGVVAFCECKIKLKTTTDCTVRLDSCPSWGTPEVVDLALKWVAVRDRV